ncbi:hypothetical protein [Azospirillum sp. sgz302134]
MVTVPPSGPSREAFWQRFEDERSRAGKTLADGETVAAGARADIAARSRAATRAMDAIQGRLLVRRIKRALWGATVRFRAYRLHAMARQAPQSRPMRALRLRIALLRLRLMIPRILAAVAVLGMLWGALRLWAVTG